MKHAIRAFLLIGFLLLPALGPAGEATAAAAEVAGIEADAPDVPKGYTLSAAYPNPFNPRTSFTLSVKETQNVRVEVFNLLGLPIRTLYNGTIEAGETRTFTFDAGDLPSGIYLYRVQGKNFTATRQMTLLK